MSDKTIKFHVEQPLGENYNKVYLEGKYNTLPEAISRYETLTRGRVVEVRREIMISK